MSGELAPERISPPSPGTGAGMAAMLAARSVAVVGASARHGTFGQRMADEVAASPARPEIYLVNPRYRQIGERACYPSLADLPAQVDLVLLGVPDAALEQQLSLAAWRGDRSAVIFGNAHEDQAPSARPPLRQRLADIAARAGMQLCGAGCMGFVNVSYGLRAIGYTEADPLPAGPVALVTHSGSVFSALLRSRRAIGFTLAVSSGQELRTAAPAYLDYALGLDGTRVLALVLEAIRQPALLRQVLAAAARRDIPVVLLTAGSSARGQLMVAAHSGALAADDGGWEALCRAYGLHRVGDLAELADTLELFAIGRRARREPGRARGGSGVATVHDSGLERAHAADLAAELGVPFAELSEATMARLAVLLDPGLQPANPLDVWGTGADTRRLFAGSLAALADDPSVTAVALAVDLVRELDGDDSYPLAALDASGATDKPLAVLASLPGAIDQEAARRLRDAGIPVLEGLRTGLLALSHLLDHADQAIPPVREPASGDPAAADAADQGDRIRGDPRPGDSRPGDPRPGELSRWPGASAASGAPLFTLLGEYGIATARTQQAADGYSALAAARAIGYPVVLKTDEPNIPHKSDVGGVILSVPDPPGLAAAYADLSARLGPRVLICETVPPGTELALGIARDEDLGQLIVVAAGGTLVELIADRAVALPPVGEELARELIAGLRVSRLLAGTRGMPPADLDAIARAIAGLSALAIDLGDQLEALDVNPLICGPGGAIAVDALAIPRRPAS